VNPKRVRTWAEVQALLGAKGLKPLDRRTATGRFWVHPSGRHVQVPDPVEDMYPEYLFRHLEAVLEELGFGTFH